MKIPIHYTDYGIGYFCTDKGKSWIELNKHLKKYPELHDMVLKHELEHATGKSMDFLHDLRDHFNIKKQLMITKFALRHPSALTSISPILISKKGIGYNLFMFFIWGAIALTLIVGGFLIWIKKQDLGWKTFGGWFY